MQREMSFRRGLGVLAAVLMLAGVAPAYAQTQGMDRRYKWERLGLDYTLRDVEPPTTEAAELASEMFRKAGLRAS